MMIINLLVYNSPCLENITISLYSFNNLQPHLTLDVKVPLFPLSDTSLTVPTPQFPERLMSEGVSLLHILSKASTPFKIKLSDDVFILVMIRPADPYF